MCMLCVQHWCLEEDLKLFSFKMVNLAIKTRKYVLGSFHLKSLYFYFFFFSLYPFSLLILYRLYSGKLFICKGGVQLATAIDYLPGQVGKTKSELMSAALQCGISIAQVWPKVTREMVMSLSATTVLPETFCNYSLNASRTGMDIMV